MASYIEDGFGCTPPINLTPGAGDVVVRRIQAPPNGVVVIRAILPTALQVSAAIAASAAIPFFVVAGGASLGTIQNQLNAQTIIGKSADLVGMPSLDELGKFKAQMLLGGYYRLSALDGPIPILGDTLRAENTNSLLVVVGNMIDMSAVPPTATPGTSAMLSVLGDIYYGVKTDSNFGGIGTTRALPRYAGR